MGSDETHAVRQESDHLARLLQYGSRRVREMPVGREWTLAAMTIAAAFAEFAKLAILTIRFTLFVLRTLARIAGSGARAS